MKIKFTIKALTALFLLSGCVTTDTESMMKESWNIPSSGTSTFDGSKYIEMARVSCNEVQLTFYQDNHKAKEGIVLLKAGVASITNIGDLLLFKLDGKQHSFKSDDPTTEYDKEYIAQGVETRFSHKTFIVPENFIRKAANSRELLAKLYLLNNTYVEGRCSYATLDQAKQQAGSEYDEYITEKTLSLRNKVAGIIGFQDFVKMMDSTNW